MSSIPVPTPPTEDDVQAVRAVLETLRRDPDLFTDEELGELAALATEINRLAAHTFVERLLARHADPTPPSGVILRGGPGLSGPGAPMGDAR